VLGIALRAHAAVSAEALTVRPAPRDTGGSGAVAH
jgi:hypothetical protein